MQLTQSTSKLCLLGNCHLPHSRLRVSLHHNLCLGLIARTSPCYSPGLSPLRVGLPQLPPPTRWPVEGHPASTSAGARPFEVACADRQSNGIIAIEENLSLSVNCLHRTTAVLVGSGMKIWRRVLEPHRQGPSAARTGSPVS